MEVWIILAATGSSYFVNLWQKNLHKEEDASSSSSSLLLSHPKEEEEEEEKLKHRSSSYNTMPMHLRYRRFSPLPTSIHHPLGIEFSIPRAFNKATEKHHFPPEVLEETEPRNLRVSSTASRPFLTQIATRPTDIAHIFDPESPLIEDGEEMPAVTLGMEMTSSLLNRGENEALLYSEGLKTATTMSSDGGNNRRKNRVLEEDNNNLNKPLLHSKGLKTATTVSSDGRNNRRKNRVHEEGKNNLELETLLHESSGLLPGVLFNFGVGVGMMFAIISSQEVKRVAEMPGQMESSLKTLEARESELSGAADKTVDAKNGMVEGEKLASTSSISNKVMSLAESITGITHSETEEKSLGDMPTLEAELEAELERMELNIHPPNVLKHRGSCELHEVDTDTVISGELSVEGLPLMIEVELEESESSSEEELPVPNYGISPRELEKRLNQVLLYRHERRIAELEAELDSMANKLQIKEEELLSWREYTQNLQGIKTQNPLDECCSGVKEDLIKESLEEGFRRDWPIPEQALKEKESVIDAKNLKKAPAFITLAGEALDAYNEACDEFLKVLSDSEESTSTLPDSSCAKMPIRRKESYISVNNGQLEEDLWEDRDLLSYVEDFTRGVVMNPVESLVLNKGGDTSDDCSSKEIISNHHLNDIGTSGSTPCSIKFIDSNTIEAYRGDLVSPYDDDTNGHSPLLPSRNRPHHFKGSSSTSGASSATTTTVASVRSKYFESGNLGSDECEEDDSDFDEKMGNLLIKRIVEKTRKGSPIVHEAQTILASLETAETPLDWNSTTLKMPWH